MLSEKLPSQVRRGREGRHKKIAKNEELRSRLFLVKNGIPFDVAFSLSQTDTHAYLIIFAELDGVQKFNFERWRFDDVETKGAKK